MANQKQTKAKPKAEPGKAVIVGQPQAMRQLPEKLGELVAQKHIIEMVEGIYATLMVEGIDYGIPLDTNGKPIFPKPMLYKSGAELLRLYLQLQVRTTVHDATDYSVPVIRFRVTTDIFDRDGSFLGNGEGSCSSNETKYRYRWMTAQQLPASIKAGMTKTVKKTDDNGKVKDVEVIDQEAWINAYGMGSARWTRFGVQVRVDSPDIFDQENTILSQAKKRSFADGIKTVTGASRIFLVGQEAARVAAKQKADEDTGVTIEGQYEVIEEAEEKAEQEAQEYAVYREKLKSMMADAGFTTPEGQLDLIRLKKLLQEQYNVDNASLLDEKGRSKLLNQLADFAAQRQEN